MNPDRWRQISQLSGQSLLGGQFGPYKILSLLGAGGMGEVYRAHGSASSPLGCDRA